MDLEFAYQLLTIMMGDHEAWTEVLDVNSEGHAIFEKFLNGLEYFPESLRNFRGQVKSMLEFYFEPIKRRGADAYAAAYAQYFSDMRAAGANTCYCNNIAPGESERTCRKVGAHRKEAKERAGATPAQKEYAKAYNRLKMRKQRRKISADEWNASVAKAQDLKAQAERGELSDEDLRRQLESL